MLRIGLRRPLKSIGISRITSFAMQVSALLRDALIIPYASGVQMVCPKPFLTHASNGWSIQTSEQDVGYEVL